MIGPGSDNNEKIETLQKKLGDDTVDVSATNGLGALKSRGLHPELVFFAQSPFREVFTLIDPFNRTFEWFSLSKSE